MSAFVEARSIHHTAGQTHIVENATLSLSPGRFVIVIGPNGAGKSSLLKMLSGESRPTSGEIICAGEPIRQTPAWRLARRRAVMAQATSMAFSFTVSEVVRIGLDTLGVNVRGGDGNSLVAEALVRADMLHLAHRRYDTLSGGEQQRTHFARVLCQLAAGRRTERQQAFYLDEPVASLDLRHQLMLMDAAREIADSGVAVMAILHDLNLAAAYADELVVMHAGKITASGDPQDVFASGLVADVFGVDLRLCATPPGKAAFILPHGHARRVAWRRPTPGVREPAASRPTPTDDFQRRSKSCATLPTNENGSMSFSFWP